MTGSELRVGLDLLHALPEIGGTWNYISSVIAALAENPGGNRYIAFANEQSAGLVQGLNDFDCIVLSVPARNRIMRVAWENTLLQFHAAAAKLSCMHYFSNTVPIRTVVPAVVTVYDLISYTSRSIGFARAQYVRYGMRLAVRKASVLAPMSFSTARDILDTLGAPAGRMVIVPYPVKCVGRVWSDEEKRRFIAAYDLHPPFWLYVAHYYEHKNHNALLEALYARKASGRSGWSLVLRGDGVERAFAGRVAELGLGDQVRFLPRLTDDQMGLLYSTAGAMVFPSLAEGGGIPVMEALAYGCPVAAADIPTTREFGGSAVVTFDPTDAAAILRTMDTIEHEPLLRARLAKEGLKLSALQSPFRVAARLHLAYRIAAGTRA